MRHLEFNPSPIKAAMAATTKINYVIIVNNYLNEIY